MLSNYLKAVGILHISLVFHNHQVQTREPKTQHKTTPDKLAVRHFSLIILTAVPITVKYPLLSIPITIEHKLVSYSVSQ
jgi:hypothetical protein